MRVNFAPALAFTLSWEGGFVNHPKDPGGATNKGITLKTYRAYKSNATVADLKAIPQENVERIYLDSYWTVAKCDGLRPGVDGAVFDYAVNSGPAAARKSLMQVVGGTDAQTVKKLCARRLSIYQTFKHWKTFGKGWTRRIVAGEALWTKWAVAATAPAASVKLILQGEAEKAESKVKQQATGATATGGAAAGGPTLTPEQIDQVAAWILAGAFGVAGLVAVYLVWRAYINRQRQKAFEAEAVTA